MIETKKLGELLHAFLYYQNKFEEAKKKLDDAVASQLDEFKKLSQEVKDGKSVQ